MDKIVIIGPPGAGKTTFALQLGKMYKIKVLHLDRLFWTRGWKKRNRDERIDILYQIIREKQWIIEGTYLSASEPRLEEADTIIFLDIFPLLCLWRIIIRHWEKRGKPGRDLPMDSSDKLTRFLMLKVLAFPFRERKRLMQTLKKYDSRRIIQLRSPKKVEEFLQEEFLQAQIRGMGTQKNLADVRSSSKSLVLRKSWTLQSFILRCTRQIRTFAVSQPLHLRSVCRRQLFLL